MEELVSIPMAPPRITRAKKMGTLFLIICGIRQHLGQMTKEHHVGFEAAAS
ncbi:hypothetical protein RYX36_026434, partial [Vicia faba]